MSSNNDFDGPYGPAGGRGANGYSGGGNANRRNDGARGGYAPPEGWGEDGFWRDSSVDANYETGKLQPLDPHDYGNGGGGRHGRGVPGAQGVPGNPREPRGQGGYGPDATRVQQGFGPDATRAQQGIGPDATRVQRGYRPDATRVQGGYRDAFQRFTGPFTGPITDQWRRMSDRMGRGPGGPEGPGVPGGPGTPGGKRGKRKGDWWRRWTWKKALAVGGGMFVILLLGMAGTYEYLYSTTTIPAALTSARQQDDIVYYSNGTTEIGTIGSVNRQDLPLSKIPTALQNAFIAAEDKSFWHEGGINPTGILRAAYHDVFSGGGSLNGGSTITQEFVRNYYGLGLQQTVSRKVKEVIISEKLASTKSKSWVLQHYLNMVYLGENSYGVEAAAETYFGVPVSKLTIAQDAILGGLPQAPSAYPQPQFKSSLLARWQYVLTQMVRDGFITQAQASAQKFPTLLTWADPARGFGASNTNPANNDPWDPYILDAVENELIGVDHITQSQLNAGGLKIVTNISLSMEEQMYHAVDSTLTPSGIAAAPGSTLTSLPSWALVGAELQDPKTGAILAMYPGPGQNQSPSACAADDCQDDTALYTREQVGSSFKPYVLSTAVKQGMNLGTSVMNTSPYACIPPDGASNLYAQPITAAQYAQGRAVGCPGPGYFKFQNDAGELIGHYAGTATTGPYAGATYYSDTVQDALAQSSNVGFTDLAHQVGTANIVKVASEYGVNVGPSGADLKSYIGQVVMALGVAPMTVNEQTTMLATIDDNGTYHTPHLVKYWENFGGAKNSPAVTTRQVLTPAQASQVQWAMSKTTVNGTAAQSVTLSRPIIGKTGTSNHQNSAFFIGAIPQYALVIGMFDKDQGNRSENLKYLGGFGVGGFWPARIWNAFATAEFSNLPVQNFPAPQFSGSKWNLLGPIPKPKAPPKPKQSPKPKASPTATCSNGFSFPGGTPCGKKHKHYFPPPTAPVQPTPSASSSAQPTVSPSLPVVGGPTTSPSPGTSGGGTAAGGTAADGLVMVLPGSLLWVKTSRRRKRKQRSRR